MACIRITNIPLVYVYLPQKKKFIPANSQILSDREKQVLLLSLEGLKTSEIASKLNISASTIKYHKHRIYRKLNVKNMQEAAYYTSVNGLM